LDYLNTRPSRGVTPCHLDIDQTGRYLCVANYRGAEGGNVAMLPIGADGSLGAVTGFIQHYGSSQHPTRQTAPHAHSANVDPSNNHVLVADLGLDKVMIYELDLVEGGLLPHETPWVATESGAGPRHLAYHPLGQYAYVINELNSTMIVYAYDPGTGTLRELQVLSTLPPDYKGSNAPADVHVLPSGRFLYGSNRGHDSIVIYAIDAATGRLSLIGHEPTGGRNPRNFAIDPAGEFLWAANQDSDNIFTFCIDSATGELSPTGAVADVPRPVCLALYQRRS
jgi:6-phosphogluconolactonase